MNIFIFCGNIFVYFSDPNIYEINSFKKDWKYMILKTPKKTSKKP